jgi:hypothetical protein
MIPQMVSSVKVATAFCEARSIAFVRAKDCHLRVNTETIARRFRCALETAQQTLKSTMQWGVHQSLHLLHQQYWVDHLDLHCKQLQETFYTDTLFLKVKSLAGHTCPQLITNRQFTRVYPMESKASLNIATALNTFFDDVGVPAELTCNLASEQTCKNTDVMKLIFCLNVKLRHAEKGQGITHNSKAETEIWEIKTKWKARMQEAQIPSRLWDYRLVYIAEV